MPSASPARSGPGAGPHRSLGGHRGRERSNNPAELAPPRPAVRGRLRVPDPSSRLSGSGLRFLSAAVSEAAWGRPRSYPRQPGGPHPVAAPAPVWGQPGLPLKGPAPALGTSLPWALLPGTAWPQVCVNLQGDLPPPAEPPHAGRPGRSHGLQRTLWGSEQARRPVTQLLLALHLSSHFCSLFPRAGHTHLNLQACLPNQEVPQPCSHAGRRPPGPGQACSVGDGAASRVPGPHLPGVPARGTPDQPTHQTPGAAWPPAGGVGLQGTREAAGCGLHLWEDCSS